MKILCLFSNECALKLFEWLKKQGHEILLFSDVLTAHWCREQKIDLTISYTYRFLLSEAILLALHQNVVNLHNSYLPWNRGADPNLWSIVDGTPRGVTLHYMEAGLDKGGIICQQLVPLSSGDTLKSSYDALDVAAKLQFQQAFAWYDNWPQMKKYPQGKGNYHSIKEGRYLHRVIDTYDLPVEEFRQRIKQSQ